MPHLDDIIVTPMDVITKENFRDGLIVAMEESNQVGRFRAWLVRRRLENPRVLERVYMRAMADAPADIVDGEEEDGFNFQTFLEWLIKNLPAILALIAMFA